MWSPNATEPAPLTLVAQLGRRKFAGLTDEAILNDSQMMESLKQDWFTLPFFAYAKAASQASESDLNGPLGTFDEPMICHAVLRPLLDLGASVCAITESVTNFIGLVFGNEPIMPIMAKKVKSQKKKAKSKKPVADNDDALLDLFVEENALAAAHAAKVKLEAQKAAEDLKTSETLLDLYEHFPKFSLTSDPTRPKLPHKYAIFLLLHCFQIRESLMQAVLFHFVEWSKDLAAAGEPLPSYDAFKPFLEARGSYDNRTKARGSVIQVVRSLLGANFGLRSSVLPEDFGEKRKPAFLMHVAYQKLYNDCFFRTHSVILLEALQILTTGSAAPGSTGSSFDPSGSHKNLIRLYEAFEQFESFFAGVDFPTFRQAFPVPEISPPGIYPGSGSMEKTKDFVYVSFMSGLGSPIVLNKTWTSYMLSMEDTFKGTRLLWESTLDTLSVWLDGHDVPSFESIKATPEFKELFSIYFGTLTKKPEFVRLDDMDILFDAINLSALNKCSEQRTSVPMEEASIMFLLSETLLEWYTGYVYNYMPQQFPFCQTIHKKWAPLVKHFSDKPKIARIAKCLEFANHHGLK